MHSWQKKPAKLRNSKKEWRNEHTEQKTTEAARRMAWEQALASSRIEGFEPDAEYLADVEKNIREEITGEEFREKNIALAKTASNKP